MTPRDNVLTGGATSRALRRGRLCTKCLRRRAVPASEGTVKRGRLRVAQQIGHFGDRQRRLYSDTCSAACRLASSHKVSNDVPAAREATLQRARSRRESSGNRVDRHLAGRGLRREDASHLIARVAGGRQTGENRGRLTFEPSPKRRVPPPERKIERWLRDDDAVPGRLRTNLAAQDLAHIPRHHRVRA